MDLEKLELVYGYLQMKRVCTDAKVDYRIVVCPMMQDFQSSSHMSRQW